MVQREGGLLGRPEGRAFAKDGSRRNTDMAEMTHEPLHVATVQLEVALGLYFAQQEVADQGGQDGYYPVITLAGAAEEIMGQMLKERGKQNSLDGLKSATIAISKRLLGRATSTKVVADRANLARNRLKHWSPPADESMVFDAAEEAWHMLDRAVDNYYGLTFDLTDAMRRFQDLRVGKNAHRRA